MPELSRVEKRRIVEGFHPYRLAAIRRGEWPNGSLQMWVKIAQEPADTAYPMALDVVEAAR